MAKKGENKKVVKKKVAKSKTKKATKTVKKKGKKVEVSIIRQFNKEVPEEMHFVLNDGRRIKSIFEFIDMLDYIDDGLFSYHANESKNDFANWMKNACQEGDLSKEITNIKSRLETQNTLLKHLIKKLK